MCVDGCDSFVVVCNCATSCTCCTPNAHCTRCNKRSSSNEVVEKKVAATIESYTDKMKRAVSATENLWKAKLKAAQDDQVKLSNKTHEKIV